MPQSAAAGRDRRWLALAVLFMGSLMIVLDSTIVNVALPSIRDDLAFSESGLAWVVNAYLLTFGGFLMLGGRMGDLLGPRRMFLAGIVAFTLASAACGLAWDQTSLVVARALQGVGGAVVSAVALSLVMTMFSEPDERAKAMGYFGFIGAGGGAIGVLLGGLITDALNWRWTFLVNLPIGLTVLVLAFMLIPRDARSEQRAPLDIGGAATLTTALLLAVYGVLRAGEIGWSPGIIGYLAAAVVLLAAFVLIESRVAAPLAPLGLFRSRNLVVANTVGVLWAGAMFAWFFISALYLQRVLGYAPLEVGLAYLPGNLIMGAFSLGLSARMVARFGIRYPMAVGLAFASAGLALFARAPVDGNVWTDVVPAMALLGLGGGMAFNPVLLAAMSDARPEDSGLASGVVNTSFMMGGALGLAILATLSASVTQGALSSGAATVEALNTGYHAAFMAGSACAFLAALAGFLFIRESAPGAAPAPVMH
jgi:EmrB/QacA subfamily drug resistance transporter